MINSQNRASLVCQIRINIRSGKEMDYHTLTNVFTGTIPYNQKEHQYHLLEFFVECYPSLVKAFMKEQNISREQILNIFNKLPDMGEKEYFKKVIQNGEF